MPLSAGQQAKIEDMFGGEDALRRWLGDEDSIEYKEYLENKRIIEVAGGEVPNTVLAILGVDSNTARILRKHQKAIIALCSYNSVELFNIGLIEESERIKLLERLAALYEKKSVHSNELNLWCHDFFVACDSAAKISKKQQAENAKHGENVRDTFERTKKETGTGKLDYQALMNPSELVLLLNQIDRELGRLNQVTKVIRGPFVSVSEPTLDSVKAEMANLEALGDDKTLFLPAHCNGHYFYLKRENMQWSIHDSLPLDKANKTPLQEAMLEKSVAKLSAITKNRHVTIDDNHFHTSDTQENDYDCATQVVNAYGCAVMDNYPTKTHKQNIDIVFDLEKNLASHAAAPIEPVMTVQAPVVFHLGSAAAAPSVEVPAPEIKVVPEIPASAAVESKHVPEEAKPAVETEAERERAEELLREYENNKAAKYVINNRESFFTAARNLYNQVDKKTLDRLAKPNPSPEEKEQLEKRKEVLDRIKNTSNEALEGLLQGGGIEGLSDEDLAALVQEKELKSAFKR